jgi:hypothetical protein
MAELKIPYVPSYGVIGRTLTKIKDASNPDRFTQDFLSTKLGLKGGSAKPVIPFLKRTGFLGSDGVPTELYKQFRNPSRSGAAAAQALRMGYEALYEVNEYAHDLNDSDLKGLVVQVSGGERESGTTRAIIGSFKALREFADFEAAATSDVVEAEGQDEALMIAGPDGTGGVRLSYNINLHLPATSDVAVFNAIFRSLREHLLQ